MSAQPAAAAPPPVPLPAAPHEGPIGVSLRSLSLFLERRPLLARRGSAQLEGRALLRDISGDFPAGGLSLILGASGCGKSCLLYALAMRLSSVGYRLTGAALFNGAPPDGALRCRIGYILQTDYLLPFLTVRETLCFAARLRLPAHRSAADKCAVVEALILELGLKDCADTRCGGARVRGISGGEARRVSTAVQLVTDPALLFCDEPTTGLDAFTARAVAQTLAAVAARGRTVVCTLHTPRADVLPLARTALLLSAGRAAYFGPAADMVPYFAAAGHACPDRTNPGDFVLDLLSVDSRTRSAEAATRASIGALLDAWAQRNRAPGGPDAGADAPDAPASAAALLASGAPRAPAATRREQAAVLFARGMLNTRRDALTAGALLAESFVMGTAVGCIFYKLGETPGALVSRTSLCYMSAAIQTYQLLVFSVRCLCTELAVYDHEMSDGMHGVLPWLAARYAVVLPQLALFPTLFSLIVYFMTGLRPEGGALGVFVAVIFSMHLLGFSLALLCVALLRAFSKASLLASTLYIFLRLVSGLLVQLKSVPIFLAWVKRISFLNFAFHLLLTNEFGGRVWPCPDAVRAASPAACAAYDGDAVLARLGIARHGAAEAATSLAVNFAVLVVASAVVLSLRPRVIARLQAASARMRVLEPAAAPLERQAHSMTVDADDTHAELSFRAFAPVTVALRDVGLTLRPTRRLPAGKAILQRITLTLCPGQFTGIMGASGSGKSSLLNALAARIRPGEGAVVSGAVLFNGAPLRRAAARAVVGYVTQHDELLPRLTVRETLQFGACLRLPQSMAPAAKRARVATVLAELGLRDCADTMVGAAASAEGGDAARGGVIGGEKRRVSIAVQMLTDPAVLICDEPTSGLDAFNALNIGATLARLATAEGRTVIATLHQPREGLFALLQQLVLLAQGRTVYAGAGGDAVLSYFEARGHACPPRTNPADCIIDAASVDLRHAGAEAASRARVAALIAAYAAQEDAAGGGAEGGAAYTDAHAEAAAADVSTAPGGSELRMGRPMGSLSAMAPLLLRRSALNMRRQPGVLVRRTMQGILFGVIMCCFFTRLPTDGSPASVQNRIGLMYELLTLIFVGMLNCIAVFPAERNVYFRESADGAYSTPAFLITYTALEVPCELLTALVLGAMMGPIAGLQSAPRHYARLVYSIFCIINAGESIGIAVCSLIYHVGMGVSLLGICLSILTAMAGFFSTGMPLWLRVVNHASVLKYAANILAVSELQGLRLGGSTSGDAVLALFRFRPDHAARDLWVLGLLTALYRLAASLLLHANQARHV